MSDLEEAAAHINALMGVTANDPVMQLVRKTRNAQTDATHCAGCGHEIKPGEPVWRFRVSWHSVFGYSHNLAPHCEHCRPKYGRFCRAEPCQGCGRPVHNEMDRVRRRLVFCCAQCQHRAILAVARHKRSHARGTRECQECRQTFEPTRTDSKFCSVACKQRAYRKRVTDVAGAQCAAGNSRNGSAP